MRSVFTSPRLENVEAVAKMLVDAGIEVKVSQDRSYKGNRRRQFSFRESGNASENPQVWVLKAEDQPKARQILREAGLIDSTRPEFFSQSQSYLPPSRSLMTERKPDRRASVVIRIRMVLLAMIVLLTILTLSGVIHR
ncbi:MAG: pathogenicity-like protein [Lysobacteraceae bacterium]